MDPYPRTTGFVIGSWAEVTEHCDINYSVTDGQTAHLIFGDRADQLPLTFDYEALQRLVHVAAAALADVEARPSGTSEEAH